MTIDDFIKNYNMHDSLLEGLSYDNKILKMKIDFDFWMQDNYDDSKPETGTIIIIFKNVIDYNYTNYINFDSTSIVSVNYNDEVICFNLMDDLTDDYIELSIKAGTIEIYEK